MKRQRHCDGKVPDDCAFVVRLEVDVLQFPEVEHTFLETLLLPRRQHVGRLLREQKLAVSHK